MIEKKSIEEIFGELDFELEQTTSDKCFSKYNLERKYTEVELYVKFDQLSPVDQECYWCDGYNQDCERFSH